MRFETIRRNRFEQAFNSHFLVTDKLTGILRREFYEPLVPALRLTDEMPLSMGKACESDFPARIEIMQVNIASASIEELKASVPPRN